MTDKSLQQVQGDRRPAPGADATRLVRAVAAARRIPLSELTTEQLRLLLGQREGLAWVVPAAVAALRSDPLAEGDCYPGDVLAGLLGLPAEYWAAHPDHAAQVDALLDAIDPDDQRLADVPHVGAAVAAFRRL